MRVRYRRSGGIANIKTQIEFDSDSLPEKHLTMLNALLKAKSLEKSIHSDDFIHELEVIDGATHAKRRFAESQLPTIALAFFDYLTQRRKGEKKTSRS